MAERYWMTIKHNVGFPSKGKYNVLNTGFYTDSITEIRKVAMDQADYDLRHQLHDGPHKIILSSSGKLVERVWAGFDRDWNPEYRMEKNGVKYILDPKTGRIKRRI